MTGAPPSGGSAAGAAAPADTVVKRDAADEAHSHGANTHEGTHDIDAARLESFVRTAFPELQGPMRLERIHGGQSNPTYFLSVGERHMVLRKKPSGSALPSAHAIDREYRVLRALAGTAIPVPRALLYHPQPDVLDTPFYVMERLEGRVFSEGALPGVAPPDRRQMYFAMARTLAKLHAIDPASVGLADFGRPGNYFARQIDRWTRQVADSPAAAEIPALAEVGRWLGDNTPPDDGGGAIAHGDFRLGNMMFHPTGPDLVGVLDWELATLGHPMADLGFALMAWRCRPDEFGGIAGLDLPALGIPSADEFVACYDEESGGRYRLLPFHIAFAFFRFSAIFVGIADRARAGNAASHDAADVAPLASRFAEIAREVIATPKTLVS